jgi:N-acetylglucosaminyldiphosphoundecaprenol N-acetyl-beta-D-mannosaminyltransferase
MINLHTKYGTLRILGAEHALENITNEKKGKLQTFHFVNAFVLAEANKNQDYFQILSNGTCFCDSRPLQLYSRVIGSPIEQLRGADFLKANLQKPSSGHHLIIGGTTKREEEVIELVERCFGKKLDISFHQPEFTHDVSVLQESSMLAINLTRPKTIWLGVGTPKQDYLASRLRPNVEANIFCVGAAIAFLVGDVLEAPKWIQRAGLEWLYRLGKEPIRLWRRYLFGNMWFLAILMKDFVSRKFYR